MTTTFNLVHSVDDWETHQKGRDARLAQLRQGEDQLKQRNLKTSAKRFRPSKELLNAINAALITRTPLLLTGEPGTGKTQVAWYLAQFFEIDLFEYQVHSNSQAKDMRYDFDAVAYLRDAYLAQHAGSTDNSENAEPPKDPRDNPKYLKKGALWKAYEQEEPCVLLIDEVDKAPRDFPNDLLQELDQNRFEHPFNQGTHISSKTPPVIILTSNGERRLPDAFLRRCMVHQIKLDNDLLEAILESWKAQFPSVNTEQDQAALQAEALNVFNKIRRLPLSKKPGTAELLLWVSVLSAQGITAGQLNPKTAPIVKDKKGNKTAFQMPALASLVKDNADYAQVTDYFEQDEA